MKRPLGLIAVGAAVALATGVVVIGMASGEAEDVSATAGALASATPLPSGHPSIAADETKESPVATSDQTQRTIDRLESEIAQHPDDVALLLDLGDACFLGQRLRQAERAYTQALNADPENAAAKVGLATVWHAEGDSARAETALKAVIASHPDDQDAHYSLAIVYFSSGSVDQAKTEWERAARIDPGTQTGQRSQSFVDLLEDNESAAPETEDE